MALTGESEYVSFDVADVSVAKLLAAREELRLRMDEEGRATQQRRHAAREVAFQHEAAHARTQQSMEAEFAEQEAILTQLQAGHMDMQPEEHMQAGDAHFSAEREIALRELEKVQEKAALQDQEAAAQNADDEARLAEQDQQLAMLAEDHQALVEVVSTLKEKDSFHKQRVSDLENELENQSQDTNAMSGLSSTMPSRVQTVSSAMSPRLALVPPGRLDTYVVGASSLSARTRTVQVSRQPMTPQQPSTPHHPSTPMPPQLMAPSRPRNGEFMVSPRRVLQPPTVHSFNGSLKASQMRIPVGSVLDAHHRYAAGPPSSRHMPTQSTPAHLLRVARTSLPAGQRTTAPFASAFTPAFR